MMNRVLAEIVSYTALAAGLTVVTLGCDGATHQPGTDSPVETSKQANPTDDNSADVSPEQPEGAGQSDRYTLPAGDDVASLMQFLERMEEFEPTTRAEAFEHQSKVPQAVQAAATRIVELQKDQSSEAYHKAKAYLLYFELRDTPHQTPEQQRGTYDRIAQHLLSIPVSDYGPLEVSLASATASSFESIDNTELAALAYKTFGARFAESTDVQLQAIGRQLVGSSRRLSLLGNEMLVEGVTVGGKKLDWDSYRGKVVLVDFWATWCGPCVEELPNVKENYRRYHERGFDVVAISLDSNRAQLENFLKENQIPWVCLFQDDAGGEHPLATYYGVSGIPTVILVDQRGKVVSLNARGPELGLQLEKLLGPAGG